MDWLLIRSLTLTRGILATLWLLWIDFLFALWHSLNNIPTSILGCGLTSYSLFDIMREMFNTIVWVVDWLLIRSLTLFNYHLPRSDWLWIDFLFALWHLFWLKLSVAVRCGLTSYSLFDISPPFNPCIGTVVDWLLIRSLTFIVAVDPVTTRLWIDFLFALWHCGRNILTLSISCGLTSYSLFDIKQMMHWRLLSVVDWLLIRSLTLNQ